MSSSRVTSVSSYHDYIRKYFPAQAVPVAEAIVLAESGGRANATLQNTNGTTDRGLFQINSVHSNLVNGNLDSLYDPETNVKIASEIYSKQGFWPWVTFWKDTYKKYLK